MCYVFYASSQEAFPLPSSTHSYFVFGHCKVQLRESIRGLFPLCTILISLSLQFSCDFDDSIISLSEGIFFTGMCTTHPVANNEINNILKCFKINSLLLKHITPRLTGAK
ncbi:hypothetical protein MTsN2n4_41930 [Pseudoalteromonas sp. MTN2-4]